MARKTALKRDLLRNVYKLRDFKLVTHKIKELHKWWKKHGIVNLIYRFRNRRIFDIQFSEKFPVFGSSITDSESVPSYATLCGIAAEEDEIFKKFRSARPIITALDHVSLDLGEKYLAEILNYGPWQEAYKRAINQIDSLGEPKIYSFKPFGKFSPTLLRYLKVYLDLNKYFGPLENYRISEIGVGFGGQACLINLLDTTTQYNLYDIPPVLQLAEKFIGQNHVLGGFSFNDGRNPVAVDSDLVISNYAFSEINPTVQKLYIESVILNSPRGYMTWNLLSEERLGGYSLERFVDLLPNYKILEENPLSGEGNKILVWGQNLIP
jgi:hypothetical protein